MNSFSTIPVTPGNARPRTARMRPASILVATDGSATSSSAYSAADLIAAKRGASVHVLSVVRPFPVIVPPLGVMTIPYGINVAEADSVRKTIRDQLATISRSAEWTTETCVGNPPSAIAQAASERSADLIIIGESHHGKMDRLLGEETSTQLARRVNLPLLVATPSMRRLPRRVVIAFDLEFDDFSRHAKALAMLGVFPNVSCVHVQPRSEFMGVDWAQYDGEYRRQVETSFQRMREALSVLSGVRPELVVLHGDPVTEILGYAESVRAEMTVVGLKPRGPVSIAPGGGVAMKLVRASHRPVLLIPRKQP